MIIIPIYALLVITYAIGQNKRGRWQRINKIILASIYLGWAVYATWHGRNYFGGWMFAAVLALCWLGDVVIIYNFVLGGLFFGLANLLSAVCLIIRVASGAGFAPAAAVVFFAVFFGLFVVAAASRWLDIGDVRPFPAYIATITLDAAIAAGLWAGQPNQPELALLAGGFFLFMISDYLLALFTFRYKGSVLLYRLNALTYFPGVMMLALSIAL